VQSSLAGRHCLFISKIREVWMESIRWDLYARVAVVESARNWVEIQRKLLRAPKTIDAYARGLNDFLEVSRRRGVRVESATRGDIACYVEDLATRPRPTNVKKTGDMGIGLANKTIQQRLTAIRLFYDFLMETGVREKIRTALSYLLLTNRSPHLDDLNLDFLLLLNAKRQSTYGLPHLYAISRALAHLKIIPRPLPSGRAKVPLLERVDTDGMELRPSGLTGVSPGTDRAVGCRGAESTACSNYFRLAGGLPVHIQRS
jgi:Phage integrase, N-terminal SAM-like domain